MCLKKILGLCILLVTTSVNAQWHYFQASAFTTNVELVFWHPSSQTAKQLNQAILNEFERIDQRFSRYQSASEVSKFNQTSSPKPQAVSAELFQLIQQAQEVSILSGGAFDITFASVGQFYDYRENKKPSNEQRLKGSQISYQDLELLPDISALKKRIPGLIIDLGGIAKGYAIDQAIKLLLDAGIENARISAGGDMRLLGDKRGKPWIVAIKDPRSENAHAVTLPLSDVAMSTSGDYERYFIDDDGNRIHHILSPSSGKPATGIQGVSVLGPDATTTDALSTAIFVLGVEKGLALAEQLPGIDVVIIDDKRKMHFSEGLAPAK